MVVLTGTHRNDLRSLCLLAGALLLLNLAACAQNPVSGNYDFVVISEDGELKIGRTNHPKIIKQFGRYKDEALQAYVQSVGERLAIVSHRDNLIYRFTVLDSPVINAFALPGGYIYITRGLMAYLNSEAELAAVLGHEIGHVTARHGVRQQSSAQAANIVYAATTILFPELRTADAQNVFNIFSGALLSGYGREHELESDGLGAEYIARAGYDPKAMIDVIRVLKDQETFAAQQAKKQGREVKGYHGLFASHPDNDTRLHEVVLAADQYATGKKWSIKRAEYLAHINGMRFGDSEEQGVRSGRNFYHLGLKFALTFPENWQVQNNPDSLKAIAMEGKAIIEVGVRDLNRKLSPQEFIQQRLQVDNLQQGHSLKSDGLQGYTGFVEVQDRLVRISVIYLLDQAFIFLGSVKDNAMFEQFDKYFLATAESFHKLQDSEISLAKAKLIAVVTVGKADNYAAWAAKSRITNSPLLQLRLLNGHYPNNELKRGQKAKRIH